MGDSDGINLTNYRYGIRTGAAGLGETYLKRYLAYAGALTALAGSAHAAPTDSTDDSLTWHGITLYGTVDVGYTYQNRGTPLSDYFPTGLQYLVQPSNNRSISSVSENGMSQSKIGLRGTHEFFEGWSGVFKLETGFNPLSGNLSDALKSITQNNGVPLANRTTQGDSSRAGQPLQGAAYGGVSSPAYGTLTIGRQNGLLLDNVLKYDPLGGSYAFSVIGYSGAAAGSGDTQDARLDNSVKYINQIGMFRLGAQFQSGAGTGSGGNATELNLGGDFIPGLSVDAAYVNKKNAILAAPLGVAVAKCPTTPAFGGASAAVNCLPPGISANTAVAATVSDNWTWSLDASYVYKQVKASMGYEDIHSRNPQTPLAAGSPDIGGYTLGFVNNDAYPKGAKLLQISWLGAKYSLSSAFDLISAWYHYNQNKYIATAKCPGGTKDSGACSGRLDAYSLVADYKFDRRFDAYAGFMWSHVADGLAAGYLNSWTIDPTIGGRFNF
jgi:predicted porin